MNRSMRITVLYVLIVFWALRPDGVVAQVPNDSLQAKNTKIDSSATSEMIQSLANGLSQNLNRSGAEEGEMLLPVIQIDAVIEKPGVSLIPKKIKTDVGRVDLGERSFDQELKTRPKEVPEIPIELESEKKIEKIKTLLGKKK